MLFKNLYTTGKQLLCCFFIFITACTTPASYGELKLSPADSLAIMLKNRKALMTIEKIKPFIHQGDMILRTGNDFTSESLRRLSVHDKTYSHCGIASIQNDSVFVYHAIGGDWNPDEKLRRDPLEMFCDPASNRGFGIFSFNLNSMQQEKLDSILKNWYQREITFDMQFDLATNDKMYCAEFVSKAINLASGDHIKFATTKIKDFEFVAVDNLFLNKNCLEKMRIRY